MKQDETKRILDELAAKYPAVIEKERILHRTLLETGVPGDLGVRANRSGIHHHCRLALASLRWGIRLNEGPRADYGRLYVSISSGFGANIECRNSFRLDAPDERGSVDASNTCGDGELDSLYHLCTDELLCKMDFLAAARKVATCFLQMTEGVR